jgi:hypothetical protein
LPYYTNSPRRFRRVGSKSAAAAKATKNSRSPTNPVKLLAATILALLTVGCSPHDLEVSARAGGPPSASPHDGANAWSPAYVDLDGREHRPLAAPDAQALAVVFITTDCPIANSYLPELNRLSQAYATRGISLLLVHADPALDVEAARQHAREYKIQPPVVLDPKHDWVTRSRATRTPEAAVFSRKGEVLYRGRIDDRYIGPGKRRTEAATHDLRDALEAILAGQPVPRPVTEAVGCYIPDLPAGE